MVLHGNPLARAVRMNSLPRAANHAGPRDARQRRQREDRQRHDRQHQLRQRRPEGAEIAGNKAVDRIEAGPVRRRGIRDVEPAERRRRPSEEMIEDIDQDAVR